MLMRRRLVQVGKHSSHKHLHPYFGMKQHEEKDSVASLGIAFHSFIRRNLYVEICRLASECFSLNSDYFLQIKLTFQTMSVILLFGELIKTADCSRKEF